MMLMKGARPCRWTAGTGSCRAQVVEHQRAHGLAADHDLVARLQVLQPRGQRAVRHLDAEELEVLVVVGAGHAVGAQQRLAVDRQADHHEVAVAKAQGGSRVVRNENSVSFQWWTCRTRSVPMFAMGCSGGKKWNSNGDWGLPASLPSCQASRLLPGRPMALPHARPGHPIDLSPLGATLPARPRMRC
jgi:hypothetical protein